MKTQTMPEGQHNETLVARTNIDWCFPYPNQCEETLKEIAKLYLKGDKSLKLKPHRHPIFLDEKGRARDKWGDSSKVLHRLSKPSKSFVLSDLDKN